MRVPKTYTGKELDVEDVKKMSVKEFREQGYLQELNRRFLHPLGLALEVVVHPDGTETIGEIWDSRDDPEGFIFGENMIDADKAIRIHKEGERKYEARHERFGWYTQPYTDQPIPPRWER